MAGAAAGRVGHVPKPQPRGGSWVAGAGPGAGPAGCAGGLGVSREGRRQRERVREKRERSVAGQASPGLGVRQEWTLLLLRKKYFLFRLRVQMTSLGGSLSPLLHTRLYVTGRCCHDCGASGRPGWAREQ